jgi:hypothetical protein
MRRARNEVHENLNKQAKRTKMISDAEHPPADVRGNVILPILDVDRAKANLRNLVGEWYLKEKRAVCTGLG